jgi:NADP-reducing hydrogenase subunit HndD
MKDLNTPGDCRMCVVEVEGAKNLIPSCATPVREGLKIKTNSERVSKARKLNYELLMSGHEDCLSCMKNNNCELQKVGAELNIQDRPYHPYRELKKDLSAPAYQRNNNKCILCKRCISVCDQVIGVSTLGLIHRGHDTIIGNAFDTPIMNSLCIECGQCVINCPTAALFEKEDIQPVLDAINDPEKFVIAQTAPAVRVAVGEGFGYEPGTLLTGKMVEALKRIGFDRVLDTTFGADITIMEEAYELLDRLGKGEKIPQFTSCCPAWVKFAEDQYPEILPNLSTAKSPHQMLAVVIRKFYADKYGIDPKNIVNVSVMPCTSKKYERQREGIDGWEDGKDIDISITTRETIKMIKNAGLDFANLPEAEFDPLGEGTGAGDIFGASGGVMEAALRTAYEVKTGKKLEKVEFDQIRGDDKIKEGKIVMDGKEIRFAVVASPKKARPFVEDAIKGKSPYHFIEVMTCPGGCVGGGGQPSSGKETIRKRMEGLYLSDSKRVIRRCHDNPVIHKLYKEYFDAPLSEKAEKYLHTHSFVNRRDC